MFNHLQDLSLSFYSQMAVGRLMARVTSDSGRVSELVTWGMLDSTWAAVNITTSAYFMMRINWHLGLVVLLIVPVLVVIAVQFRKKILVEFRNTPRQLEDHGRIQRKHPGRARRQGAWPRG